MLQEQIFKSFLDDASFSYEQRLYLINDPEYYWKDLQNMEMQSNRIICSFFPGKNPKAHDFCLNLVDSCSAGELYIILVIFLRSYAYDEIYRIIQKSDFIENIKKFNAVSNALKHEASDEFIEILSDKMMENHSYIPLVLEIYGFKRIRISEEKLDFIIKNSEEKKRIVRYLGRVKRYSIDFTELIKTDNDSLFYETAIAITRIQNESLLEEFYKELHNRDWAVILKSLTGKEEFEEEIYEYFKEQKTNESVLAVALTGKMQFISDLIEILGCDELKDIAALSLHILTGAGIEEKVFIYEEIDEDLLFDDELERLKNGEEPYKEDKPREKVIRISQNLLNWQKWWDENKNRFYKGTRYRLGLTYSAVPLIEMLKANLPAYIRQLAYEELSIHFGVDIVFETDMFVKDQIKAIDKIERTL